MSMAGGSVSNQSSSRVASRRSPVNFALGGDMLLAEESVHSSPWHYCAVLTTLIVGAVSACRKTAHPPSARTVAGCYAFARAGVGAPALGREMPDTLRLDSALQWNPDGRPHPLFPQRADVLSRRPDAGTEPWVADGETIPWPPDWTHTYNFVGWRFTPPDSVVVALWPPGMQGPGWELHLRVVGDSLIGRAEAQSDVIHDSRGTIAVVGHHIPCRGRSELARLSNRDDG